MYETYPPAPLRVRERAESRDFSTAPARATATITPINSTRGNNRRGSSGTTTAVVTSSGSITSSVCSRSMLSR